MANVADADPGQASEESIAQLLRQLSEQTSRLASARTRELAPPHREVELAKAERAEKGKRDGLGAGFCLARSSRRWSSG